VFSILFPYDGVAGKEETLAAEATEQRSA